MDYLIREVLLSDAEEILNIYNYYILNTAITFEIDTPDLSEFKNRIKEIKEKYPYICLEKNNEILGYAYAHILKDRDAYKHSVEISIYIKNGYTKLGYGKILYQELEKELLKMGVTNFYSCITKPIIPDEYVDDNSINFHKHMGYKEAGLFNKCGKKFGKYYNVVWMEKIISEK